MKLNENGRKTALHPIVARRGLHQTSKGGKVVSDPAHIIIEFCERFLDTLQINGITKQKAFYKTMAGQNKWQFGMDAPQSHAHVHQLHAPPSLDGGRDRPAISARLAERPRPCRAQALAWLGLGVGVGLVLGLGLGLGSRLGFRAGVRFGVRARVRAQAPATQTRLARIGRRSRGRSVGGGPASNAEERRREEAEEARAAAC